MAEFEEKLNSLLSNPDAMAQIMQLAQAFSGGGAEVKSAPPPPEKPPAATSDIFSASSDGMDPALLIKLLPLLQEIGGQRDSNARQLLYALRPYLKEERQEKVERALQLARLFCVGKKFLKGWEAGNV